MTHRRRPDWLPALAVLFVAALVLLQRDALRQWAYGITGEEDLLPQVRGLLQRASDLTRTPLALRPETPIAHAGVNPFGINTFLEQEVEPAKREQQLQLISAAGFRWIRQEFPWYDIEIHAKDDFEDRRFEPYRSAWDKYDNIVELAEQNNIQIVARLSAPPNWSRAAGDTEGPFAPPDDYNDFADYAYAVASRYAGRVDHFQIWNEPNIYPEWGDNPVNPEEYVDLLCRGYRAIKRANPDAVVLAGAIAPTASLTQRDMNDFVFLEQMYAAGFANCYDIMSVQGYGLWSGPTDTRLRPVVINYARNQFVRDIMVRHGEGHKAIWISEMNWNAVPPDSGIPPNFGQVTLDQQARFAPQAYQRAESEWPWVGVVFFWFFKRASDAEVNQPFYYFRMADPDFTLMPVYASMAEYANQPPVLYRGYHQEDHWALTYDDNWAIFPRADAALGQVAIGAPGATLTFMVDGGALYLVTPTPGTTVTLQLADQPPRTLALTTETTLLAQLPPGPTPVTLTVGAAPLTLDALIVRPPNTLAPLWPLAALILALLALYAIVRPRA